MAQFPAWLHALATISLALGAGCALWTAADVARRPQRMGIMNLVWPLTMLFGSLPWLAFYFRYGRTPERGGTMHGRTPMAVAVAKGSAHCGAGCALGDLIVEWSAHAMPSIAILFGWGSLFAEKSLALWIPDYLVAFAIGIAFQYFAIAPMRGLSLREGLVAAVRADAASITAWQAGMYGTMAAGQFAWFRPAYGGIADVATPEFWWLMQLAMLAGFATSYPVNWWLIARGWKERM